MHSISAPGLHFSALVKTLCWYGIGVFFCIVAVVFYLGENGAYIHKAFIYMYLSAESAE